MMNQHVPDVTLLRGKKPLLWTPWGSQRLPDLDRALAAAPARKTSRLPRRKPIAAGEAVRGRR